ncbi:hypothetical protein [Streptomyces sp. or20]|uniref:hypothetical protein n=1 Tax=Streptomyces sp. or20 TaxID=1828016 RepID=UPI00117D7367|nr:hypothetical protein [Streptomyces sp. or20]
MSTRGRRASLPGDAGHHRTPALAADELLVRHTAEDGVKKASYDFAQLAVGPRLQRELAEVFAAQCESTGAWRTIPSSEETWRVLRHFSDFLAAEEHVRERLGDLTPEIWAAWRLSRRPDSSGSRQIGKVARLLREHPEVPEDTRNLMKRRTPKPTSTEFAYSDDEFDRIKLAATQTFRRALYRIRGNWKHLQDWRAGRFEEGTRDWLLGKALAHLMRTGETPFYISRRGRQRPDTRYTEAMGSDRVEDTWMRLFMTTEEASAMVALLIAAYGWNATPIMEMKVPLATPDAGEGQIIYRIELEKRRRGKTARYESRNLTDWGADSPGRLITHVIEATTPAREALVNLRAPTTRLVVWRMSQRRVVYGDGLAVLFNGHLHRLNARADKSWKRMLGDGLSLNLRRLRKTVVIAHERQPTQHSQDTHDAVYVLPDPRTHATAQPVIADGIVEAVESARESFKAQVTRAETDARMDTATASCSDYTHSPFGEQGVPCRASFLLCIACPNAVITPRHLPRLAYLLHVLDELKAVLAPEAWAQDWSAPYTRLRDLRQAPDFTDTEWSDALEKVTKLEREVIDQLLKRGFDA